MRLTTGSPAQGPLGAAALLVWLGLALATPATPAPTFLDDFENCDISDWVVVCGGWEFVEGFGGGLAIASTQFDNVLRHSTFSGAYGHYHYDLYFPDDLRADGDLMFQIGGGTGFWNLLGPDNSDNVVDRIIKMSSDGIGTQTAIGCTPFHLSRLTWHAIDIYRYPNGVIQVFTDNESTPRMEAFEGSIASAGSLALRTAAAGVRFDNISFAPIDSGGPPPPSPATCPSWGGLLTTCDPTLGGVPGSGGCRNFTRLLVLAPGESAAPGTPSGRSGTASSQPVGSPFNVTVLATDDSWYPVTGVVDVVHISSGDPAAQLPADAPLVDGSATFAVQLGTSGYQQITASDVTQPGKSSNTTLVNGIIVSSGGGGSSGGGYWTPGCRRCLPMIEAATVWPNPSNPTILRFTLRGAARVSARVYDIVGREVARLADGEFPAGTNSVRWNGRWTDGSSAKPGLYFIRLRAGYEDVRRTVVHIGGDR